MLPDTGTSHRCRMRHGYVLLSICIELWQFSWRLPGYPQVKWRCFAAPFDLPLNFVAGDPLPQSITAQHTSGLTNVMFDQVVLHRAATRNGVARPRAR